MTTMKRQKRVLKESMRQNTATTIKPLASAWSPRFAPSFTNLPWAISLMIVQTKAKMKITTRFCPPTMRQQ